MQRLIQLVASLKENNNSLSEMFGEYKKFSSQQLEELEGRLATMSVEKAEKVFQLDVQFIYSHTVNALGDEEVEEVIEFRIEG